MLYCVKMSWEDVISAFFAGTVWGLPTALTDCHSLELAIIRLVASFNSMMSRDAENEDCVDKKLWKTVIKIRCQQIELEGEFVITRCSFSRMLNVHRCQTSKLFEDLLPSTRFAQFNSKVLTLRSHQKIKMNENITIGVKSNAWWFVDATNEIKNAIEFTKSRFPFKEFFV